MQYGIALLQMRYANDDFWGKGEREEKRGNTSNHATKEDANTTHQGTAVVDLR